MIDVIANRKGHAGFLERLLLERQEQVGQTIVFRGLLEWAFGP